MVTADDARWQEGEDGDAPYYRERLWPSPVIPLVSTGLAGLVGVAYGAAYGPAWGWAVGLLLATIGLGLLAAASPVVGVDDRVLRAGRARLPLAAVGASHALDPEAMRHERRMGDPRTYLMLRAWSTRKGILVEVADPRDPHPRWIISTRRPERLLDALRTALEGSHTA